MTRFVLNGLLCLAFSANAARADLDFRRVARTGDTIPGLSSPIASFGHYVSMNDLGQVAFKAKLANTSEAIVRATPNADGEYDLDDPDLWSIVETANGISAFFGDYVSINQRGEASYRRKTSAGPAFSIRRDTTRVAWATTNDPYNWYFKALLPPTDISTERDGMVSFYGHILDDNRIRQQIRKGDGRDGYHVSHTTLIATQPEFSRFNHFTSINDGGWVVFTGSHPTNGEGVFVGDGMAVAPIATTTLHGFTQIGTVPTINNNHRVAFYGESGADKGIYLGERDTTPVLVFPITSPVESIAPSSSISINDRGNVAFMGNLEDGGGKALFRTCSTTLKLIVQQGDEIDGAEPINDVALWSGLNTDGAVAFWARHSDTTESLLVAHLSECQVPLGPNNPLEVKRLAQDDNNCSDCECWPNCPRWGIECLGEPRCCDAVFDAPEKCRSEEENSRPPCPPDPLCEPSNCTPCKNCNQCTIAVFGCTLTCATMLNNYYFYETLYPSDLNEWPIFHNTQTAITNNISWAKVAAQFTRKGVQAWHWERKTLRQLQVCEIEELILCHRIPIVARVKSLVSSLKHNVVCYGIDETAESWNRILIRDPGRANKTTLWDYRDGIYHFDYLWADDLLYDRLPRGSCEIMIASPAELLVSDRMGRRTGYDSATGEFLNEIPGVAYTAEWSNDDDGPPQDRHRVDAHKSMYIPSTVKGVIDLRIVAQRDAMIGLFGIGLRENSTIAFEDGESIDMGEGQSIDRVYVVPIMGDFDIDGDIDIDDFGAFYNCLGGPGAGAPPECLDVVDFDGDEDIDLVDFSTFLARYTGASE